MNEPHLCQTNAIKTALSPEENMIRAALRVKMIWDELVEHNETVQQLSC